MTTDAIASAQRGHEKSVWWRAVLGEYPTGVCLVASRGDDDEPIGMVVGSFVAVSEEPPLIGFFAGRDSRTLPELVSSGRFSASVLSDDDETFCRAFASKAPDRWDRRPFVDTPNGAPRLADAVAWFDASIESTRTYGDHIFVVGRVHDFGAGAGGAEMPLLFRRAGYGSFSAPGETYDARAFIERLRWASMAEREIESLSSELGVEVAVNTQLGDSVVTLASVASDSTLSTFDNVGAAHPWAAPISPVFAAWAPTARRHAWEEASRHLTGSVDRALIEDQLRGVRERGYAIAGDQALTDRFLRLVRGNRTDRVAYARVWAEIAASRRRLEDDDGVHWGEVAVVQVPIFDEGGDVVLSIYAIGWQHSMSQRTSELLVERMRTAADRISTRIAASRTRG